MTEHDPYILRVELEDFANRTRYAEYQSITIGNAESKYRLDIDGYSGNAGLFTNRII
jgi:ficolin